MAQGSSGIQKSIVRSGAKGTSVSADVTSTSISTDVQALDISLKSSIPAGNNAIGKLSANDGIDIGDVTINNSSIAVTDNGSSLTVDAPLATPVYVRISNGTTSVDALPVTDNGGSLTVDGSISVSNFPTTQAVSGTVTVAQATAANLNATVTGNVAASQSGTWNIGSITTFPTAITTDTAAIKTSVQLLDDAVGTDGATVASGMLRVGGTDGTNNQTISVNTSGHINIADGGNSITVDGPLTNTELRASAVPVSLASVPSHAVTNAGTFAVQAAQSGTWNINAITTLPSIPAGNNNIGDVDVASLPGTVASDITAIKTATELLDDSYGLSGSSATVGMLRVGGTDGINNRTFSVNNSGHLNIADGGNSITVDGTVGISGTVPVSGTFWQATQPVSIASAVPVTDNGGSITVDSPVGTPTYVRLSNGTTAVDTLPVSLASVPSHPVTNAGTFAVQATQTGTWNIGSITTLPALAAGTNNIGSVSFNVNSTVANAPTNSSTTAYASSLIVKASAGVLYAITGFNSRSSGQFIQLHDSATLPADTSVPKVVFYVESNSNFSFDLGIYGRGFSNGIVICNSSSGPTKTIGAADCWFDVQYK